MFSPYFSRRFFILALEIFTAAAGVTLFRLVRPRDKSVHVSVPGSVCASSVIINRAERRSLTVLSGRDLVSLGCQLAVCETL